MREGERKRVRVKQPYPVAWGENCSAADSGLSLFDNAPLLTLTHSHSQTYLSFFKHSVTIFLNVHMLFLCQPLPKVLPCVFLPPVFSVVVCLSHLCCVYHSVLSNPSLVIKTDKSGLHANKRVVVSMAFSCPAIRTRKLSFGVIFWSGNFQFSLQPEGGLPLQH